ncbi:MAG: hypothetical protein AAB929_02640 [Patescibacteria group bacterium]
MRISPKEIIKRLKKNDLDIRKTAFELGIHRSTSLDMLRIRHY